MPHPRYTYHKAWREAHKEQEQARLQASYARDREAIQARRRARRLANLEESRARAREYSRRRRAKHPEYRRAYREANRETIRVKDAAYHAAHRPEAQQRKRQYEIRKRGVRINDLSLAQWREIVAAYDSRCAYCGRKMQRLTQDHILPLSKGGQHTAANVVPACKSCNSRKKDRAPLSPVQPLLLTIAPKQRKRRGS